MIQVTPQMRVLVAVEPTDFRRGIDGLSRVCKQKLLADPLCGTVFVFRNRRATSVKRKNNISDEPAANHLRISIRTVLLIRFSGEPPIKRRS